MNYHDMECSITDGDFFEEPGVAEDWAEYMLDDTLDWWREQDAEMTAAEIADIELQAEIQEYRTQGYM